MWVFIERDFGKDIVVCSWIPFSKKGSYHKETSQLVCNTNSAGFCWKTLLHRLWLMSPSCMDFSFCNNVLHSYMLNWKNLQSPDINIIFVVSRRKNRIKIIKSALLRVSQNNKLRNSHVYKCQNKGTSNLSVSRTKSIVAFVVVVLVCRLLHY